MYICTSSSSVMSPYFFCELLAYMLVFVGRILACQEPPTPTHNVIPPLEDFLPTFTFTGLPNWLPDEQSLAGIPDEYINVTRSFYLGRQNCVQPLLAHGRALRHTTINNIALCPFSYYRNYDVNRVPRTLLEARCTCEEPGLAGTLCQEVVYHVRVVRRSGCGADGYFTYRAVYEPVSVACVAVVLPKPRHAHSHNVRMSVRWRRTVV